MKHKRQSPRYPSTRSMGFTVEHEQGFRQEGIRSRIHVSMDCSTVEWIDPASLRKRIFRATGAQPHGGLHPQINREGKGS
jgi:hypothetical protein